MYIHDIEGPEVHEHGYGSCVMCEIEGPEVHEHGYGSCVMCEIEGPEVYEHMGMVHV